MSTFEIENEIYSLQSPIDPHFKRTLVKDEASKTRQRFAF